MKKTFIILAIVFLVGWLVFSRVSKEIEEYQAFQEERKYWVEEREFKEAELVEFVWEKLKKCRQSQDLDCTTDWDCNYKMEKYCGEFIPPNCELIAYWIVCHCGIKGNISSEWEKIYHTPNCLSYEDTEIDIRNGEKWFCSLFEAREEGRREAENCDY